jgi:hypothetical protein
LGFPSGFAPRSYPRRTPRWGTGRWTLARDYTFDINLDPPFGVSTGRVPLRVARLRFNPVGVSGRPSIEIGGAESAAGAGQAALAVVVAFFLFFLGLLVGFLTAG